MLWTTGFYKLKRRPERNTLAGCKVTVYEHLDGTILVRFAPHEVARSAPDQIPAPVPHTGKRRFSPDLWDTSERHDANKE